MIAQRIDQRSRIAAKTLFGGGIAIPDRPLRVGGETGGAIPTDDEPHRIFAAMIQPVRLTQRETQEKNNAAQRCRDQTGPEPQRDIARHRRHKARHRRRGQQDPAARGDRPRLRQDFPDFRQPNGHFATLIACFPIRSQIKR